MVDLKSEEILTCFMLIIVGYYIAKMFSRRCNGFRVGGQPRQPLNDYIMNPYLINCNEMRYKDGATERDKALACNSFRNCTWNPFLKPPSCTYK